ncbi:MAG: hypothetical protein HZB25_06610 [Candidatus Eisenbacteria bacterium]|nr:hypothetical protein [Candidatus Eisenbacteria bacterium]
MPPTRLIPAALLAVLALVAPAGPARADAIATAWRDLQAGVNRADVALMERARGTFEALSLADAASADLHACVALADWRMAPVLSRADATRKKSRPFVEDGLAQCDAALKLDPKHAEALALKASLQGLMMGFEPAAVMQLGPASDANLKRALELAPADPRVWLLQGIMTLNRPAFFGGGADKAMPEFRKAVELFAARPADTSAATWGRDDALLWAGRAATQLKQADVAREYYRQALKVNPSNGWAHRLLADLEPGAAAGTPTRKDTP